MKLKLPSDFFATILKVSVAGTLFLGMSQGQALAATNGYAYRTKASGTWHSAGTWERFNTTSGLWEDIIAADVPDATAGVTTIQSAHSVTLSSATAADQLVIAAGGTLILNADLNLADGTGTDMLVNGTLVTNTRTISGAGEFMLDAGATMQIGSPAGISGTGSATGNIQVSGLKTYSPAAAYMYNGTAAQVTGNGLPASLNVLQVNNLSGVTLSQAVTASNVVLTAGVLKTTQANRLILAAAGSISGASAAKFVDGPLGVTLASGYGELQFPVGKNGNFRTIELNISQSDGTPTIYTVEQVEGVHSGLTLGNTLEKVSGMRYFNISKSAGATLQEAFIKMNYGANDYVTDRVNLTIAKSEGSSWMDLKGTDGVNDGGSANGIGYIQSTEFFNSLGTFILANKIGGTNPLPVELVKFYARALETNVVLDWTTASEKNNDYFLVERSRNGKTFETVGKVSGNGTTSSANSYSLLDKNLPAGLHYYRLKQVDLNGAFEYSQVIKVTVKESRNSLTVYPNPTSGQLKLNSRDAISQVRILNVLGQEIFRQNLSGQQTATLDINFLPAGTYQLLTDGSQETAVTRFVKLDK